MNTKLLALAQNLNIPFIEDGEDYYFGVSLADFNAYLQSLNDSDVPMDVIHWKNEQDGYIDFENLVEIDEYCRYFTYENEEYLILSDRAANEEFRERAEDYIDTCILSEIPERYHIYFDREAFIKDCYLDGRGHSLAGYDGEEREETLPNGETYYLYRTN